MNDDEGQDQEFQVLIPQVKSKKSQINGSVEAAEMTDEDFERLRRNFNRGPNKPKNRRVGSELVPGYSNPWAGFEGENIGLAAGPTEEERLLYNRKMEEGKEVSKDYTILPGQEKTIYHGSETETDYLGRNFMHVPQDLGTRLDKEPGSFECFAPKRIVHTWTGHSKGVNAIRFFPNSGHLLLSASQDCRVKIWDVYRNRKCIRTYLGHNKPVRDICFNASGAEFASCGFDKFIKHWDTETGKCITSIETKAIPFCVKIHPDLDKQNIVMAGCADKRIMQWDLRSGEVVQEYNQHLDSVNSITFFDKNKKFVSSSDDKTLRVWEYDIPVTAKYIADPGMHSMPAAALHPDQDFIAFQSMNNQIHVYSVNENKFQQRKKKFTGHSNAGYACQLNFSPDGKFLVSGDGKGDLALWDWRNGHLIKKLNAHKQVCIGVEWHPQEPSRVATCSWDGTIKLWD